MNDRPHSGNSFLDMVFIFVFPLGHMRTSTDDVLLIFFFFLPYLKNQGLFSFPLKHLFSPLSLSLSLILGMGCKRLTVDLRNTFLKYKEMLQN